MGYTTKFSGYLEIRPPLGEDRAHRLNAFFAEPHVPLGAPPCPSEWCDWEVSGDGSRLSWNGSEKSYQMTEWLWWLMERNDFLGRHELHGIVHAQGESVGDVWSIVATGRSVQEVGGRHVQPTDREAPEDLRLRTLADTFAREWVWQNIQGAAADALYAMLRREFGGGR